MANLTVLPSHCSDGGGFLRNILAYKMYSCGFLFTVNLSEHCSRKYTEKQLHNSQDVCRDKFWMTEVRK